MVPEFGGAFFMDERKDALWDRFYTGAPIRLRQTVEQYNVPRRIAQLQQTAAASNAELKHVLAPLGEVPVPIGAQIFFYDLLQHGNRPVSAGLT